MGAKKSRKSPRAQVSLVARYRSPTAFEFVREECFDLSIGGMFIKSPAPAPAGTLLKLECDVDEGAARIRGVARVVWLREQSIDGHPAGMGVKFVKLEPGGRDVIAGILDRLGTELDEEGEQRRSQAPPAAAPGPFQRTPSARPDLLASAITDPTPAVAVPSGIEVTHPAPPSEAITVRPPAEALPGAGAVVQPVAAPTRSSSPAATSASADQQTRELRERLQQARRQSSSPPAAAVAVAKPAPRAAAADAPDAHAAHAPRSRRPLLYAAILLLAASGVYALTRSSGGAPVPPPAPEPSVAQAPKPAPEPPRALPPAVAPPAQDTVPTSIAPGAPRYVLEVVTQPEGARVTAGSQTLVAPGELDLGALDGEVVVTAQLDGHLPAQASVDRVGFMLDEGAMRRRLVLKLNAAPQPPKPEPEPSARKSRRERSAERAEREPKAERAPKPAAAPTPAPEPPPPAPPPVLAVVPTAPAPAPVAAVVPPPAPAPAAAPKPKAEAEAEAEEKPADSAPKQRPIDAAMACLGTGDNACVVKALEGKAKSAQELELLIETYRAMGNAAKAEKYMEIYVDKHPGERRAAAYRRLLEHQQAEGAAPPP
jgi:hypothetical protein